MKNWILAIMTWLTMSVPIFLVLAALVLVFYSLGGLLGFLIYIVILVCPFFATLALVVFWQYRPKDATLSAYLQVLGMIGVAAVAGFVVPNAMVPVLTILAVLLLAGIKIIIEKLEDSKNSHDYSDE